MHLASVCAELDEIALLTAAELQVIRTMRRYGEAPEPEAEARCYAAGFAQIWLLVRPLQLEALELETVNSWVA